jgi:hypothetical protein
MGNKLYLECYAGISGDMMVAALLDLGADKDVLKKSLKSIPIEGFSTKIERVKKAGLDMCSFSVLLDKKHENRDHDMEYLHGNHDHSHTEKNDHQNHQHLHTHDHNSKHIHSHEHKHEHRNLKDIINIINRTDITASAKEIVVSIFEILAKAEAKAHGKDIEEVHFHEVGGVDSIVDIIAVAVCLDNLNLDEVIVPVMYEGTGSVRCQHGVLPIPVPAVSNIIAENGLKIHIMDIEGEFITPTGAAIVAAIRTSSKMPDEFSISRIGLGAGKRNYKRPSILRAMIIETSDIDSYNKDVIYKLESNIDDSTGEQFGYVMDRLINAGARDVNYMPVFMKKNRPGYQLNVICKEEDIDKLEGIIFQETTTIGIRKQKMDRTILDRKFKIVKTSLGEGTVKICETKSGIKVYPEYESVVKLCEENDISYVDACKVLIDRYYEDNSI